MEKERGVNVEAGVPDCLLPPLGTVCCPLFWGVIAHGDHFGL